MVYPLLWCLATIVFGRPSRGIHRVGINVKVVLRNRFAWPRAARELKVKAPIESARDEIQFKFSIEVLSISVFWGWIQFYLIDPDAHSNTGRISWFIVAHIGRTTKIQFGMTADGGKNSNYDSLNGNFSFVYHSSFGRQMSVAVAAGSHYFNLLLPKLE